MMNLHKEGRNSIIIASILLILISVLSYYLLNTWSLLIIIPAFFIWALVIWFFRNPERKESFGPLDVVAPVDGKVVLIKEVYEKEILKKNCIQISIFMSPLNVHICRYPISGKVSYTKYHPGKYLVAWHEKSSELNERTTLSVTTQNGEEVAFRQIAGALARRIVMNAESGDKAEAGNEFGFIKFGSRMDVFLPLNSEILVNVNDKTSGGVQKIAIIQ